MASMEPFPIPGKALVSKNPNRPCTLDRIDIKFRIDAGVIIHSNPRKSSIAVAAEVAAAVGAAAENSIHN